MPSLCTATVTGKTGAGLSMTAQVFNNIRSFKVDVVNAMLELIDISGAVTQVSIGLATTFTAVLSAAAGNWTITVS